MRKMIFYVAGVSVAGNCGAGVVMGDGDEICTVESGAKVESRPLEKAVEELLRIYRGFRPGKQVEIYASPTDYEKVYRLLPPDLRDKLDTCSYNPAVQVAAEFAIGERT